MSTSTEQLNSDSPLPCPRCEKLFRLPDGFTTSNALACPHCQEQVTGREILDALAPTATIVEGVSIETAGSKADGRKKLSFDEQDFVIPKPLKTATRRSRSRHPERKGRDKGDEAEVSNSSRSSSSSRSGSRTRSSRRQKKEASAAAEIVKIIFGGILALPIAQLILWWGFNADPASLAEPTSSVVSFIVPPKLRLDAEVVEDDMVEEPHNKDMPKSQKINDKERIPRTITR